VDTRLIKRRMKNSQRFVTTATANDAYIKKYPDKRG